VDPATLRALASRLVILSVFAAAAFLLLVVGWAVFGLVQSLFSPEPSGWLDRLFARVYTEIFREVAVIAYAAVYLAPVIIGLPFICPVIVLWRRPAKLVLLRPFNRGWPNRIWKRIVRRSAARFGHVYTLADTDIRVPFIAKLPFLLGQLSLFTYRLKKIRLDRHVDGLVRQMDNLWLRNLNWCLSLSRIFVLTSAAECWRSTVTALVKKADVIMIDATELRPNVLWEIEQCRCQGIQDRVLLFVIAERRETVLLELSNAWGDTPCPAQVFSYDRTGVSDPLRLHTTLLRLTAAKSQAGNGRIERLPGHRLSLAAATAFSLGFYPLLPLAFYPDTVGSVSKLAWFPRWNPWSGWPQFAQVANVEAVAIWGFGVATLVLLILAMRDNRAMKFPTIIQLVLLAVTAFGFFPTAWLMFFDWLNSL
jgi:hypothetical protein